MKKPKAQPTVTKTPAPGWLDMVWTPRQRQVLLLVVVACSVLVRGVYFAQLAPTPLAFAHRWDQSDMHTFHLWGEALAKGDWLTRRVTAPLHQWQLRIAQDWLTQHPDAVAALPASFEHLEGTKSAAPERLYAHWARGLTYYQEPLYPYLVGLTYWLTKPDPRFVFAWQLLLGVLTNVLLVLLAREAFGDVVSAVTGALAVLCAPLLFMEMLLLRESLIVFMGALLVWLFLRASQRGGRWWLVVGVAWGLGVLLKNTFLVVGGVLAAVQFWRVRDGKALAFTVAGFIVATAPVMARNVAVGVSPFALAGNGAITFLTVNVTDYPSERGGFYFNGPNLPRIMGETDGKLGAVIWKTFSEQSLGHILVAKWHALAAAWRWFEHPNNESFYFYRDSAWALRLPITFFVLGPLALVGLFLARKTKAALSLAVLLVTSLVPLVLFYSVGRLRLPLLAVCIPFAALTVVTLGHALRAQNFVRAGSLLGALVLVGLWTTNEPKPPINLVRSVDLQMPFRAGLGDAFEKARAAGNHAEAAAALEQVLAYEPVWMRDGSSTNQIEGLRFFSSIHQALAVELQRLDKPADAKVHEALSARQLALAGVSK